MNTEKKNNPVTQNEPIKENKKELPKKEAKNQPKRQVNFRGRVGEFHRDALYRTIPAPLQRNAYKEMVDVLQHSYNSLITQPPTRLSESSIQET